MSVRDADDTVICAIFEEASVVVATSVFVSHFSNHALLVHKLDPPGLIPTWSRIFCNTETHVWILVEVLRQSVWTSNFLANDFLLFNQPVP